MLTNATGLLGNMPGASGGGGGALYTGAPSYANAAAVLTDLDLYDQDAIDGLISDAVPAGLGTLGDAGEFPVVNSGATALEYRVLAAADIPSLATSKITSGTFVHERGGLEADVSAYSGLVKISGGATSQAVAGTDYSAATQVTAGITASATQTQGGGALTLNAGVTDLIAEVATCAADNNAITLPAAGAGLKVLVIHNGAEDLQIWPASGDNLGAGVDTSITLAPGRRAEFEGYDSTNWRRFVTLETVSFTPSESADPGAMGQVSIHSGGFFLYVGNQWLSFDGATFGGS